MALRDDVNGRFDDEVQQDGRTVSAAPSASPASDKADARAEVKPATPEAPRTPEAPSAPPAANAAAAAAPNAPEAKKPSGRKRVILLTLLVLALGAAGYFGYGWWTNGRFMVSTDDAYVQADITILAAKVSGYVKSVEAVNNQQVKAGDVIARIDDGDYRLALEAAQGKLATQRSTAERISRQVEAARAAVAQAEPQVDAARADATRTTADLERQTRLAQSDYASKARVEQSQADFRRAQANVKAAEAGLLAARANVAVLQAQRVEADRLAAEDQIAVDKAQHDLSFTQIRAPVSGVIGNRAVEVGGYVQPGTRMAALVPLTSVRVDANFKETQLGSIRPGQKVAIEVDAFPGREFPGTVESVAPASGAQFSLLPPENATGNFTKIVQRVPVRIRIDPAVAAEGLLRPGLSVVVRVDSRDKPESASASAH